MKLLCDLGVHDLDGDSSGAIGINDSGEILVNTTKDGQDYKAFLVKLK